MSRCKKCLLGDLEPADNRRMGYNQTIIPQYSEHQLFPSSVLRESVLVFAPGFADSYRVLQPWLRVDYRFHENLDAGDVRREGSKYRRK